MTFLLIQNLPTGQDFELQVRSVNANQVSEYGPIFPFTTAHDLIGPAQPQNFTFVISGTSFIAKWDAVTTNNDSPPLLTASPCTDLDHYVVVYTPTSGPAHTKITKDTTLSLSFDENKAMFGSIKSDLTAYVFAVDTSGNVSPNSTSIEVSDPQPAAPLNFTGDPRPEAIYLQWDKLDRTDIDAYVVDYSTTGPSGTFTNVYNGPNNNYTIITDLYSTDHYFRVAARDSFGTLGLYATLGPVRPESSFTVDDTAPDVITNFHVTTDFDNTSFRSRLNFTWDASTADDVEQYRIRFSQDASHWEEARFDKTDTSGSIFVDPNKSYYTSIKAVDYFGNAGGWAAANVYPILSAKNTTAPSKPTTPSVAANALSIQVSLDGNKQAGGAEEFDVTGYEIYAHNSSTVDTTIAANKLGVIPAGFGMVASFPVPASNASGTSESWWVRSVAVNASGLKSTPSDTSSQSVPLLANANIQDATITYAKIHDVHADQIEAGTGFINDLTVKSTFTLGTTGPTGATGTIESFDYVANTSGFKLSSAGLEINDGSISANALKIQNSANIMPGAMANFELESTYYLNGDGNLINLYSTDVTGVIFSMDQSHKKFGLQSFKVENTSATARRLYFTKASTNNIFLPNDGSQYFVSMWIYPSVSNAITAYMSNGSTTLSSGTLLRADDDVSTLTPNVWQQVYFLTSGISQDSANINIDVPAVVGSWVIDGVQVEKKNADSNKPGAWAAPGSTVISGGQIQTGEITSNAEGKLIDPDTGEVTSTGEPAWSIDLEGDATFGDVRVNGSMFVGQVTDDIETRKMQVVQSSGFQNNVGLGWALYGDGSAIFNNIRVNTLTAESLPDGGIDGSKIGTITADKIVGGEISSTIDISGQFQTKLSGLDIPDTSDPDLSQVLINGDGITVIQQDGTNGTVLGSDGTSTFTGVVNAEVLNVDDALRLSGDDNLILPTGVINLTGKIGKPGKPKKPVPEWYSLELFAPSLGRTVLNAARQSDGTWMVISSASGDRYASNHLTYDIYWDQFDVDFTNYTPVYTTNTNYSYVVAGAIMNGDYYLVLGYPGSNDIIIRPVSYGFGNSYAWRSSKDSTLSKFSYDDTYFMITETSSIGTPFINRFDPNNAAGTNKATNGNLESSSSTGWTSTAMIGGGNVFERVTGGNSSTYCARFRRSSTTGTLVGATDFINIGTREQLDIAFDIKSNVANKSWSYRINYYNSAGTLLDFDTFNYSTVTTSWQTISSRAQNSVPDLTAKIKILWVSDQAMAVGQYLYVDNLSVLSGPVNWVSNKGLTITNPDYPTNFAKINGFLDLGTYYGNSRYVVAGTAGTDRRIDSWNSSGTLQSERFPQPDGVTVTSIGYDGTNIWSFGTNGRVYKHEENTFFTSSKTWWYANAWYRYDNGVPTAGHGPYHGPLSNLVSFTMKKRARVRLDAGTIPNHNGDDDPNAVRFFLASSSTAPATSALVSQYESSQPAAGILSVILTNPILTASGGHYGGASSTVTSTPFPDVTNPGVIVSSAIDGSSVPYIKLSGDGSGRVGPMSWNTSGVRTSDTGYINSSTITSASGFSATNSRYRVLDSGLVDIIGRIDVNTAITVGSGGNLTNKLMCTLPTAARPTGYNRTGTCWVYDAGNAEVLGLIAIDTDGTITLISVANGVEFTTIPTTATINFSLTYMK